MNRKLILMVALFLTSTVFADGWFVGVNTSGNLTRQTPVGDLPMARQDHDIESYDMKDYAEIFRIRMTDGGTSDDTAHLMTMQLNYSAGWSAGLEAGYKLGDYKISINGSYSQMKYDSIRDVADDQPVIGADTLSGETNLWTGLLMGEYILPILNNSDIEPVIGAGIGVSRAQDILTHDGEKTTREQAVFAYKFKVGINYNFTKQLQGNIGTSFFGTGNKIKATNNYLKQWQFINLGVRWIFD